MHEQLGSSPLASGRTKRIERFSSLASEYRTDTDCGVALITDGATVRDRGSGYDWLEGRSMERPAAQMIEESVRWGEPNITMDRRGAFVWCVPVFDTNEAVGGLFSTVGCGEERIRFVHDAAWHLLELAEKHNLCNSALMQANRVEAVAHARRAEALHASKENRNPRDIYLIEEQKLLSAVRRKNVEEARKIINTILIGVYEHGNRNFELLKPLVLEMVVQMYRAAIEEGADPAELLGVNTAFLGDLLEVDNEYDLYTRLSRWLDVFVNVGFGEQKQQLPRSLAPALLYMRRNLDKPLSRDRVARVCNLSPSYFSRLLKASTGYTFSELLNRTRTDYACTLLEKTALSASEITFATGFNDQSYFTKIFKQFQGTTPGAFRQRIGSS